MRQRGRGRGEGKRKRKEVCECCEGEGGVRREGDVKKGNASAGQIRSPFLLCP